MSIQSQITRLTGEVNRFEELNDLLETAINSLPEAGSGGGSGSGGGVETCDITLTVSMPVMASATIYYTDSTMQVVKLTMSRTELRNEPVLHIVKGTILVIYYDGLSWMPDASNTSIFRSTTYSAIMINNSGTIDGGNHPE